MGVEITNLRTTRIRPDRQSVHHDVPKVGAHKNRKRSSTYNGEGVGVINAEIKWNNKSSAAGANRDGL